VPHNALWRVLRHTTRWRPYPGSVEILLWLVPPAVVTLLAMLWVSWLGREGRGEVDREEAVRRLSKAMGKDHPGTRYPRPVPVRDRSTGIAVRPSVRRRALPEDERSTRRAS
jgi:hypothetical protein